MSATTASTPTPLPAEGGTQPDLAAPTALPHSDDARRDALANQLLQASLGTVELFSVCLGDRLGLYRTLAEIGPTTPATLARRAGTDERTTREWLEQQAVAGVLDVDDAAAEASARRYGLSPGHAEVLLDGDSLSYLAPLALGTASVGGQLSALVDAFRTGRGLPFAAYGRDVREAQERLNRPPYLHLLGQAWLPAIPDVHARLQADPPARVADFGCGAGWSSIAIARAYPKVSIDGFDLDADSIAAARSNAAAAGVGNRVCFHVRDAADHTLSGDYDLATAFECLHDMGRPVETLRAMRRLTQDGGAVLVMDEGVGETFTAPGDMLERFMYGWSVLFCLPVGLADAPSAGTGTVMRPSTLRRYAQEAGFRDVEILPIRYGFWRFYRLVD